MLKKAVSILVTAALLVTAPGLPFYSALAQGGGGKTVPIGEIGTPVTPVPTTPGLQTGGAGAGAQPVAVGGNLNPGSLTSGLPAGAPALNAPASAGPATDDDGGAGQGPGGSARGADKSRLAPVSPAVSAIGSVGDRLLLQTVQSLTGGAERRAPGPAAADSKLPAFYGALKESAQGKAGDDTQALLAPSEKVLADPVSSRSWGLNSFAKLFGLGRTGEAGSTAAPQAAYGVKPLPPMSASGGRRLESAVPAVDRPLAGGVSEAPATGRVARVLKLGLVAGLLAVLSVATPVPAFLLEPAAAAAAAPSGGLIPALGHAGYLIGNGLAFVFPFFSVFKLYQQQRADNTATSGPAIGFGASMLNAAISMSTGSLLWGVQNLFSGFGLLAIVQLARRLNKSPGVAEPKLPPLGQATPAMLWSYPSIRRTVYTGLILMAASVAVFFTGAALLPAVMPALNAATPMLWKGLTLAVIAGSAWLSILALGAGPRREWQKSKALRLLALGAAAAGIFGGTYSLLYIGVSSFNLLAQIISGFAFTFLVIPDIVQLARFKGEGSGSPWYYLAYFVASMGLGLWAFTEWYVGAPGPETTRQFVNTTVYALSGAPAGVAFFMLRHYAKKAKREETQSAPARQGLLSKLAGFFHRPRAPGIPSESGAVPAAPFAALPQPKPLPAKEFAKQVREDILGFRRIKGLQHDETLKASGRMPLRAWLDRVLLRTPEAVQERIQRQFHITREELVRLAQTPGVPLADRAAWVRLFDDLQAENRRAHDLLDSQKGRYSYRDLAGAAYVPGWGGALGRAGEVQKHWLWLFVRFPYHLFDMFLFQYFRKAWSFHLLHDHEDFLSIGEPGRAAKTLERLIELRAPRGTTGLDRLTAWAPARLLKTGWEIALQPLFQFTTRRLTLAVFGAVSMGLVGGLAAFPFMSWNLATPGVLAAGHWAAGAVPALAAAGGLATGTVSAFRLARGVRAGDRAALKSGALGVGVSALVILAGSALGPVFSAAIEALLRDMVVGPLLNTLVLSKLITYPKILVEELALARRGLPPGASLGPVYPVLVALRVFFVPIEVKQTFADGTPRPWYRQIVLTRYYRQLLVVFVGMVTVGAEIEGILKYAGVIDAALDPIFWAFAGVHFTLFHDLGAAVERPSQWMDEHGSVHRNLIPFGGAITWGNVLLYKAQDLAGFNLSDAVLFGTNQAVQKIYPNPRTAAYLEMGSQPRTPRDSLAARLVHRKPGDGLDPDQRQRIKEKVEQAIREGRLEPEIVLTRENIKDLEGKLGAANGELAKLKAGRKPLPPGAREEHDRLAREVSLQRDRLAILDKLAQKGDLLGKGRDPKALEALAVLDAKLGGLLADKDKKTPTTGYRQALQDKEASTKALEDVLGTLDRKAWDKPQGPATRGEPLRQIETAELKEIKALLDKMDDPKSGLMGRAMQELKIREEMARLMASLKELRDRTLTDFRARKEMGEFQKKFAQLAMVVELSFAMNKLVAAQRAIRALQAMLDAQIAEIERQKGINSQNNQNAQGQLANVPVWKEEIDRKIADNNRLAQDMMDLKWRAENGSLRITEFRTKVRELLQRIDAEDGAGGGALAEYNRVLGAMAAAKQKAIDGDPNDPNDISLKSADDKLKRTNDLLGEAWDGMRKIDQAPRELAGLLVILVPGEPAFHGSNPTNAQILQYVDVRRAHWQAERAKYQDQLDFVARQLDPGNADLEKDALGISRPVSKVRMLADYEARLTSNEGTTRDIAQRMDALAAEIEAAAPGARIPRLSGRGYKDLGDVLLTYADALGGFDKPDTIEGFRASMKCLQLAELLPHIALTAVRWAEADKTVPAIQKGLHILRMARFSHEAILNTIDTVLADGEQDRAYLQAASHTDAQQQGLITRKKALLEGTVIPNLETIRNFLSGTLKPYVEDGLKTYDASPGHEDNLVTLYEKKKELVQKIQDGLEQTFPRTIASAGAKEGEVGAAEANIATQRRFFQKYIDGYTDAAGYHKGINEFRVEIAHRKDPNFDGKDTVYGREMWFSLPRRMAELSVLKDKHYALVQSKAAEIDKITAEMNQRGGGRFNIQRLVPLAGDPNSLVDVIEPFGNLIKQIGEEAKARGGSIPDKDADGKPSPNNDQRIAMLAVDAENRLLPSPISPDGTSMAENTAEFLFNDGIYEASKEGYEVRVPRAEAFMERAYSLLVRSIAELDRDLAFVRDGGESGDALLNRKLALLAQHTVFAAEGVQYFTDEAVSEQGAYKTLDDIRRFYEAKGTIMVNGDALADADIEKMRTYRRGLQETFDELEIKRRDLVTWLGQLDPKEERAILQASNKIWDIMDKLRDFLEKKVKFDRADERFKWADRQLGETLAQYGELQRQLAGRLKALPAGASLDPKTLERIQRALASPGAWMLTGSGGDAPSALVIRKEQWPEFSKKLLTILTPEVDVSGALQGISRDPSRLSDLIPGSKVLSFGDDANGFYLVYSSYFSTPGGLETSSTVTLGNVARLWGQNLSLTGYHFASPPNPRNAPWGDQGLAVTIESIEGENWVNYLDITFHRLLQDIPDDKSPQSQAKKTRMMVFENFAILLAGDRLYVGAAGFADFALNRTKEQPYYYGGNVKTSIQFNDYVKLNAKQQALIAEDPRKFEEILNLDYTGFDPRLHRDVPVVAKGDRKDLYRTEIGPTLDVARWMKSSDPFTVDVWVASQSGTDDVAQKSAGGAVLKGFSFPAFGQTATLTGRTSAELGEKYNSYTERLNLILPETGLALTAEGKMIGRRGAYHFEATQKTGRNSQASIGYGSKYVGMNDRLTVSLSSQYTLAEIFKGAVDESRDRARGGKVLKGFNESLERYYDSPMAPSNVKELRRAYDEDIARRLLTAEIGTLAGHIGDLTKEGSLLHNSHIRTVVGYVSGPVSEYTGDKATGGGFQVAVATTLKLKGTQGELIDRKVAEIFLSTMQLKERMVALTKEWQALVLAIAQAEWETRIAEHLKETAPDSLTRQQAEVRIAEAQARRSQAALKYNAMTGRSPSDPLPFHDMSQRDLEAALAEIQQRLHAPLRLSEIFASLLDPAVVEMLADRQRLQETYESRKKAGAGKSELEGLEERMEAMDEALEKSRDRLNLPGLDSQASFLGIPTKNMNPLDWRWLRWVDEINVTVGAQLSDVLANQLMGLGAGIKIPLFDASRRADQAYALENQAIIHALAEAQRGFNLRAAQSREEAALWSRKASELAAGQPRAAQELTLKIAAYRNGLAGSGELWEAVDRWRWYTAGLMEARAKAALAGEKADLDAYQAGRSASGGREVGGTLEAWFKETAGSHRLAELSKRAKASARMREAAAPRISKVGVELNWGMNVTTSGVGWLPLFGITGFWVMPILNLELKPSELAELEEGQFKGQEEFYKALAKRVKVEAALELYQNYLGLWTATKEAEIYRQEILPALERAARESASGGRARAQEDLDRARSAFEELESRARQSRTSLNYLMDNPLDASVALDQTPEQASTWILGVLAEAKPALLDASIHASRVDVAKKVQGILDKGLTKEQVRVEPVSLVVRSLGRLLDAFMDEPSAAPNLVEKARQQTLEAERGRESYLNGLSVAEAKLETALASVRADLKKLEGKTDPRSRIAALGLRQEERILVAGQKALADKPAPAAGPEDQTPADQRSYADVPTNFKDLKSGLVRAEEAQAVRPDDTNLPDSFPLPDWTHAVKGYDRWFQSRQTLDGERIDRTFKESWLEAKLKDPNADPKTLKALADLQRQKGDRIYRAALAGSRVRAEMLAAQFETNVQLYRWTQRMIENPQRGLSTESLRGFQRTLQSRLGILRQEIVARLQVDPETRLDELMRLVPETRAETGAQLLEISQGFLRDLEGRRIDAVRQILFEGTLPKAGEVDIKISKLEADMIAQRMSYKGFTPVFATGLFRGTRVWMGAIEAPDPTQIEAKLVDVFGDALMRELGSRSRVKELSLRLHAVMKAVEDGTKLVAKRQEMVAVAQDAYLAELSKAGTPLAAEGDKEAAEAQVAAAFEDLTASLVQLRTDFVSLVSDLEAIGMKWEDVSIPGGESGADLKRFSFEDPKEMLLSHWSGRLKDAALMERQAAIIAKSSDPEVAAKAKEVERLARNYREAYEDARITRLADIDAARRIQFLSMIDPEGKRIAVQKALGDLLAALSRSAPAEADAVWDALFASVREDLKEQGRAAGAELDQNRATLEAMREAYWRAEKVPPPELDGAVRKLEGLWREKEAIRQRLLKEYIASQDRTLEFLLQNMLLDKYLKAVDAYDKELLALMAHEQVSGTAEGAGDPELARALDTLFDYRETHQRQQDKLGHGRGLMALDALVELAQARLDALKYHKVPADRIQLAARQLDHFRAMKDRWKADASEISGVYAVVSLAADGGPIWEMRPEKNSWITAGDYARLKAAGPGQIRIVTVGGRDFFMDEAARLKPDPTSPEDAARLGALEALSGADIRRAAAKAAEDAATRNRQQRALGVVFKDAPFALVSQEGAIEPLATDRLSELKADGRVFYFSAQPDASGLRRWLHPWIALTLKAGSYDTLIYTGPGTIGRDRFETREALEASQEAGAFKLLETGPQGFKELAALSNEAASKSRRSGFVSLKLTSYGFAMDAEDGLTDVYLTRDEFEKAMSDFDDAPKLIAREKKTLRGVLKDMADAETGIYGRPVVAETGKDARTDRSADEAKLRQSAPGGLMKRHQEAFAQRARLQGELDAKRKEARDAAGRQKELEEELSTGLGRDAAKAGRRLEGIEKKLDEEMKELDELRSKERAALQEIARLERLRVEGRTKRWFLSDRMAWFLDASGQLVDVEAAPAKGQGAFRLAPDARREGLSRVDGRVEAVELDRNTSAIVKLMRTKEELEEAAKGFEIKDIAGGSHFNTSQAVVDRAEALRQQAERDLEATRSRGADPEEIRGRQAALALAKLGEENARTRLDTERKKDPEIRPLFRIWKTVNPKTGNQIYTNVEYLLKRMSSAESKHSKARHYAYLPASWPHIPLQVLSGVAGLPRELITGDDPRQQGWLGKVYGYKAEGLATERHGVVVSILMAMDFLDIFYAEQVDRYLDPSQFPQVVQIDGPILPWESVSDKDMRDVSQDKDIHFGRRGMERQIGYLKESLDATRSDPLLHLKGGSQGIVIDDRRGRARTWQNSAVDTKTDVGGILDAAKRAGPSSLDRDGRTSSSEASPKHLEVDRIQETLTVWPGAEGLARQSESFKAAVGPLEARLAAAQRDAAALEKALAAAEAEVKAHEKDRSVLRGRVDELEREVRKLSRRIGEHDARERFIRELLERIRELRNKLAFERAYLAALLDARDPKPQPPKPEPPKPPKPGDDSKTSLWRWVISAAVFGILLWTLWELLKRKGRKGGSYLLTSPGRKVPPSPGLPPEEK